MEALTPDMIMVLVILAGTVVLFITEVVRIDVAAIGIMVTIGLLGLVAPEDLFSGFASNAVVAIIGIMILGGGLDRAGVMRKLASFLVWLAGEGERRVRATISGAVAGVSGFMQNMGAAALFLPVAERMADQTKTPASRILMPMGFTALIGGNLTLVGSSPKILLNDLLASTATNLDIEIEQFGLFAPAPVGLVLVATVILLFTVFDNQLLPKVEEEPTPDNTIPDVAHHYGLDQDSQPYHVPYDSLLAGRLVGEVEAEFPGVFLVAMYESDGLIIAPPRDYVIKPNASLALLGAPETIQSFAEQQRLVPGDSSPFSILRDEERAGLSEVLVRPESNAVGNTVRQMHMRGIYGVTLLAVYRKRELITENLRDVELKDGDVLIVFSPWEKLDHLAEETSLVKMAEYPSTEPRPGKMWWALGAFGLALGLVIFSGFSLPLSLMTGVIIMLISGVLSPSEAYNAVSWQTVFLLGGLIPLGMAVEQTGTARWIAEGIISAAGGLPLWGIQLVVAVLTTGFTLTISNVGATVLLVPLAANIAVGVGADPGQFGMIVALAASNSFLLPTHQVNALMMTPGSYEVSDYLRAGGAMTVAFFIVLIPAVNLLL